MDCEISRDSQMSYLRAIQKIPGDTAGEKLSWIGRLALHQTSEDLEQLPPELLPLLRVETAVKKKRHEDITSALKCEDLTIINRAFKASWFFDGSHKEIVDVAYFCERLFPYVSVNTRARIVNTLDCPARIQFSHNKCSRQWRLLTTYRKPLVHCSWLATRLLLMKRSWRRDSCYP